MKTVSAWLQVNVKGLKGLKYFDNVDGIDHKSESEEAIGVNGETDRIYKDAGNTITVIVFSAKRSM